MGWSMGTEWYLVCEEERVVLDCHKWHLDVEDDGAVTEQVILDGGEWYDWLKPLAIRWMREIAKGREVRAWLDVQGAPPWEEERAPWGVKPGWRVWSAFGQADCLPWPPTDTVVG